MKASETIGMKANTQYRETVTICEVIDGVMIRTREQGLFHHTKLFVDGKIIERG